MEKDATTKIRHRSGCAYVGERRYKENEVERERKRKDKNKKENSEGPRALLCRKMKLVKQISGRTGQYSATILAARLSDEPCPAS